MSDKPQKINIGFLGGQTLSARVSPDELAKLRRALQEPQWHDLTAEDGIVTLDLTKVVYILADHEATRVGFGS